MNRLASETSPYLRQHADNPVHWQPWGERAFEQARAEDKPVLLSVGYSACHWCHVMAHESFEDPDTAAVMNELFVNVKVDREERPDVDAVYMEAVQLTSGGGGWPMTVFLTPDGQPIVGGTYFPKTARHGLPAFVDVLRGIDEAWRTRRDDLLDQAQRITRAVGQSAQLSAAGVAIDRSVVDRAVGSLREQHDDHNGGFGAAPKFPQTMSHELLLTTHARSGAPRDLDIVVRSLDAMAAGGIYDHVGGGFARYSVDAVWLVPHFEKMLYDQALLARLYLHGWQVTGAARFRQVVEETIEYTLGELRDPLGGFYSAEDADSDGVEGKFYVWRPDEIRAVIEPLDVDADEVLAWYGVTDVGNFEGANILHRPERGNLERPPTIETARAALFDARAGRVRPSLDDKVLTEWNGLMLATLAEAGAALGRVDWLDAATATAEFLVDQLRHHGRWLRSWQAGRARHLAYAADHAVLVDAFTHLAEATGEARWIDEARATADALLELFWDDDGGGLFTTGSDAEQLIARQKDLSDNATPSANGQGALALLRLAALTGVDHYRERSETILALVAPLADRQPTAFTVSLTALDLATSGVTEVVVAGDAPELAAVVHQRYLPNTVLAWNEPYDSPLWEQRHDGRAYVCRNYACQLPVDDPAALAAQLEESP